MFRIGDKVELTEDFSYDITDEEGFVCRKTVPKGTLGTIHAVHFPSSPGFVLVFCQRAPATDGIGSIAFELMPVKVLRYAQG